MTTSQDDGQASGVEAGRREHELQAFLRQDLAEIVSEYGRIYSRSSEDPGTAGDEGEENWAALLREWLPESYRVVTKGRILGTDGTASLQIDVLVLSPAYPLRLVNKKVYLASGVAAAFECKTTLRADHIKEAASTAAAIRKLAGTRTGTPFRELTSPPVYGLLAHSHTWKGQAATPRDNVDRALRDAQVSATHPRNLLDLICVADLACWDLQKMPYMGEIYVGSEWPKARDRYRLPDEGGAHTTYVRWDPESGQPEPNPVAVFIAALLQRLGWTDESMRPLADYFRLAGLWGSGKGEVRSWPLHEVYSDDLAAHLQAGALVNGIWWSEWSMHLP